jgi:hypothetical protein
MKKMMMLLLACGAMYVAKAQNVDLSFYSGPPPNAVVGATVSVKLYAYVPTAGCPGGTNNYETVWLSVTSIAPPGPGIASVPLTSTSTWQSGALPPAGYKFYKVDVSEDCLMATGSPIACPNSNVGFTTLSTTTVCTSPITTSCFQGDASCTNWTTADFEVRVPGIHGGGSYAVAIRRL